MFYLPFDGLRVVSMNLPSSKNEEMEGKIGISDLLGMLELKKPWAHFSFFAISG